MSEDIDRIAIAIRKAAPPWFPKGEPWEKISEDARNHWRHCAIAAIKELGAKTGQRNDEA